MNEILKRLKIKLNSMQEAASAAINGSQKDVVILSPTGTGKTLAYLLPLVQTLRTDSDAVQAVVLVPSRELAQQSAEVVKTMKAGVQTMSLYGGRPTMDEHRALRDEKPQIVFATPGRLNDHLDKQNFFAGVVKWLVIDEFDKCLEMGFQREMEDVITKLPSVERRILLSATELDSIPRFVRLTNVKKIDYTASTNQPQDRIEYFTLKSPTKDKLDMLYQLLLCLGDASSIVFLNYRDAVKRVADFLKERGFGISVYHGGLDQKAREAAIYRFANGSANILISTNLGSRGLDIPNVENIIHYHLPETVEDYTHRIGRTARWDKAGATFFLLSSEERIPESIQRRAEAYALPEALPAVPSPRMATLYIGKGKKDKLSKGDIVGFLCKKGELKANDIGRIDITERFTYVAIARRKVQQVLRLTRGEKIKGLNTLVEELK